MKINTDARLPQNESLQSLKQRLYEIHREVATLLNAVETTAGAALPLVGGTLTGPLTVPSILGMTTPLSVAQGGTGVAAGAPCFSAYKNVAQTIANTTFTKLTFQTEDYDLSAAFDSGANSRFQPAVAGYYQVNACATLASTTATHRIITALYKNGVNAHIGSSGVPDGASFGQSAMAALIYLNGTTDYIELFGYISAGATGDIAGDAPSRTRFQSYLVRAA